MFNLSQPRRRLGHSRRTWVALAALGIGAVAWGPTVDAIAPEQLTRARKLAESWNVSDEPPVLAIQQAEHA